MVNKKKISQISLFIIIGILIIILGIILIASNKDNIHIFVPSSSNEVYNYVLGCLDKTAIQGMQKIGEAGGWLYIPPKYQYQLATQNTYNNLIPNEKGFIDIGGVKYLYWYYYDDSSKTFKTNIPLFNGDETLNMLYPNKDYSIRAQLERYINKNIGSCINNFNFFKNKYDVYYNPKEVKVNVKFLGNNIYVSSHFNLRVRNIKTNETKSYSNFYLKKYNYMKRPYFHALALIEAESKYGFIDKKIWDFLTAYQTNKDRKELPPTAEVAFQKYDLQPWIVPNVKNTIKEILEANLPLLTFYYSNNQPLEPPKQLKNDQFVQGIYKTLYKDFLNYKNNTVVKDYPSVAENFKEDSIKLRYYSFFPLYFKLGGASGNYIYMPKAYSYFGGFIPFFWTKYNTQYNLAGPVLIDINSYYNNGFKYEFKVPVEFNIRRNKPLLYTLNETSLNETYQNLFGKLSNALNNANGNGELASTLVCNPSQFISKRVYFNLTDPVKDSGVKGAIVLFNCKNIATCYVGNTTEGFNTTKHKYEKLYWVNKTYFATRLPINCYPGNLTIFKIGYKKVSIGNLNPNLNTPINLGEIQMPSGKTFKARVEEGFITGNDASFINPGEYAIVVLESLDDPQFTQVIKQTYQNNTHYYNITLIPGRYRIFGVLIYNKSITIPAKKVCYNAGFFPFLKNKKCVSLPTLNLKKWVLGVVQDNKTFTLTDIKADNTLIIRVPNLGRPTNYNQLLENYQAMYNIKFGQGTVNIIFRNQ